MPPARVLFVAASVALLSLWLLVTSRADARVEAESPYTVAQTFNGALRYVRVDMGYEIVEKDAEAGYLLFRYQAPGEQRGGSHGSVEVVSTRGKVKVFVQLPKLPEYHERVLRDGLMRKLKDEYGSPPPRERPREPSDAGAAEAGEKQEE